IITLKFEVIDHISLWDRIHLLSSFTFQAETSFKSMPQKMTELYRFSRKTQVRTKQETVLGLFLMGKVLSLRV
ncbi:hypothetical protein ACWGO7_21220, partial [Bacillus haynesii]